VIPANSDYQTVYWLAKDTPAKINEGLDLLRQHIGVNSRIACLCYSDPFSFALGLPPAVGTPLFWDDAFFTSMFREQKNVFDQVDIVMIPLFDETDGGCCKMLVTDMESTYGKYLHENFIEADRSEHWILLVKRELKQ
jgi:hypothetical protein